MYIAGDILGFSDRAEITCAKRLLFGDLVAPDEYDNEKIIEAAIGNPLIRELGVLIEVAAQAPEATVALYIEGDEAEIVLSSIYRHADRNGSWDQAQAAHMLKTMRLAEYSLAA